jgi:hypothetical protein
MVAYGGQSAQTADEQREYRHDESFACHADEVTSVDPRVR